jgi:hypothetical protein
VYEIPSTAQLINHVDATTAMSAANVAATVHAWCGSAALDAATGWQC